MSKDKEIRSEIRQKTTPQPTWQELSMGTATRIAANVGSVLVMTKAQQMEGWAFTAVPNEFNRTVFLRVIHTEPHSGKETDSTARVSYRAMAVRNLTDLFADMCNVAYLDAIEDVRRQVAEARREKTG